jgi:hypothetical protein
VQPLQLEEEEEDGGARDEAMELRLKLEAHDLAHYQTALASEIARQAEIEDFVVRDRRHGKGLAACKETTVSVLRCARRCLSKEKERERERGRDARCGGEVASADVGRMGLLGSSRSSAGRSSPSSSAPARAASRRCGPCAGR